MKLTGPSKTLDMTLALFPGSFSTHVHCLLCRLSLLQLSSQQMRIFDYNYKNFDFDLR